MNDRMIPDNRVYRPRLPASPTQTSGARTPAPGMMGAGATPFADILQDKLSEGAKTLTFSQHAAARLRQRGIAMKPEEVAKLNAAVDKAASKGAKDSLLLYQDTAFIVNVKNRTVVTAVDGPSMKDNVFTQIDSAVIVS